MAWYHVNSCDCPIGCCDCGDTKNKTTKTNSTYTKARKFGPYTPNFCHACKILLKPNERNGLTPTCDNCNQELSENYDQ